MFWHSITPGEQQRLVEAAQFELSKVETMEVRERVVNEIFNNVDHDFAVRVAAGVGVAEPPMVEIAAPRVLAPEVGVEHQKVKSPRTKKVAVLAADGVDAAGLADLRQELEEAGVTVEVISKLMGELKPENGKAVKVDKNYVSAASVMYDAVIIAGGPASVEALAKHGDALHWMNETYKHCKTVAAFGAGVDLLRRGNFADIHFADGEEARSERGVVTASSAAKLAGPFLEALSEYRHWERADKDMVPA
jgi:catalase